MFEKNYPNINWWVHHHGYVQLGGDGYMNTDWFTLMDEGGVCWSSGDVTELDDALLQAEIWLYKEIIERLGETPPKVY